MFETKNNTEQNKIPQLKIKPEKIINGKQQRIIVRSVMTTLDKKFIIFGDDTGNFWYQKIKQ